MISRRSFLAALAAVPFVGKYVGAAIPREPQFVAYTEFVSLKEFKASYHILPPTPDPWGAFDRPLSLEMEAAVKEQARQMASRIDYDALEKIYGVKPRLTFAEWDRMYQG